MIVFSINEFLVTYFNIIFPRKNLYQFYPKSVCINVSEQKPVTRTRSFHFSQVTCHRSQNIVKAGVGKNSYLCTFIY